MTKEQLAVLDAALAWRACDEAEPIPSPEPNKKLLELVYVIDALRKAQSESLEVLESVPATVLLWETYRGWLASGHPSLPSHMARCPRRAFYRLERILPEASWDEAFAAVGIPIEVEEKATAETPASP